MTPARVVVEAIIDAIEAHDGLCLPVNRDRCSHCLAVMTAAEAAIDAALRERERATWQAASTEIDVELTLAAERERDPVAVDALCRFRDEIAAALAAKGEQTK